MILLRNALLLSFVTLIATACVDVFKADYDLNTNLLTVEGILTDQPTSTIRVRQSRSNRFSITSEAVQKCVVEIRAGDGTLISLRETAPGSYTTPVGFSPKQGESYQLRLRTPTGQRYESTAEVFRAVPDITKVYHKFNAKGILDRKGIEVFSSSFDVFVDFQDSSRPRDLYLWSTRLFERQPICATCTGYFNSFTKQCVNVTIRGITIPDFDYKCDGSCWEIISLSDINLLSDAYSNGQQVTGKQVARVPFYSEEGCLVEISQYNISEGAYRFFSIVREQAQTTGTLADVPPSPAFGNITNTDVPTDRLVGYFGVGGVKQTRYWIDRAGYASQGKKISLLGREPLYEAQMRPSYIPFVEGEIRPPLAPCVNSESRTPFRPQGWRN
jgi:Domain of unknown function (DUF4249)